VNAFADNDKSCNDGYSFYKTNASNKAFPIFKIESTSNKKIKIKKFKIKGNNNETIYEKNISLIIDPYSIKTFEPFNFISGIIKDEKIPNLNPKVIKNYYLTCEWYDEKSSKKNLKDKIFILMCGGHTIFYPKYPITYEEILNDDNLYYAIGEKKIAIGWDWKEGRFTQTIPITSNTTETIVAISEDFWNTKSKKSKFFLDFNKYSMKMIVGTGVLDKNLFTKDKIQLETRVANCSTIDVKKLFKLKPRID
tara:strand:+ start:248 stop:1000 length:753 start_codon:yes stop_codon:yes gene_type:complete